MSAGNKNNYPPQHTIAGAVFSHLADRINDDFRGCFLSIVTKLVYHSFLPKPCVNDYKTLLFLDETP